MIFIRASSPLCLVVARAVILYEFKERLGVALEEEIPGIKELQEKLEKKEELVRKHENEIKNLTGFNRELHKHYKEKSKRHQNDFELVANEKAKLSQKVVDLESQLDEHSEFIRIVKSCDKNDNENPEDDQNKEICPKCPHLLFENKNLRESLSLAESMVSLRDQELDLWKKKKSNHQEENNADISG